MLVSCSPTPCQAAIVHQTSPRVIQQTLVSPHTIGCSDSSVSGSKFTAVSRSLPRATLEEIQDASLILHIVDISHPNADGQSGAVMKVRGCDPLCC